MPADYAVLAPIYILLEMDHFAEVMTPRLIDLAQRHDWLGRRILDLGCGTGASLEWLIRRNYVAVGIDESLPMLEVARLRLETLQLQPDVRQADVRSLGNSIGPVDLVLALDVLNELSSLRDLEALFGCAHQVLEPEKMLIFDMHTIKGLCEQTVSGDAMILNQADLTVISSTSYDYERQVQEQRYLIFQRQGDSWQRSEAVRVLRSYPVQAVASLLQRCGFQVIKVVTTDFNDYEPGLSSADRVLILAVKQ